MGVSKNRGTPKWMVYNGKPYYIKWLIWGYHYFRKHPYGHFIKKTSPWSGCVFWSFFVVSSWKILTWPVPVLLVTHTIHELYIFIHLWHKSMVNVGRYSIHGILWVRTLFCWVVLEKMRSTIYLC